MEVYRGERRFLSVDMAAVLATGDTLTGSPTVTIVEKRGRAATTLITTPAPAGVGTEVRFWVLIPGTQERLKNFLILASCATVAGETVAEEAPLLVL